MDDAHIKRFDASGRALACVVGVGSCELEWHKRESWLNHADCLQDPVLRVSDCMALLRQGSRRPARQSRRIVQEQQPSNRMSERGRGWQVAGSTGGRRGGTRTR